MTCASALMLEESEILKEKKNGESGRPVCTNTYTLCLLYIYNLKCQSITMIYKINEKLHDNSPTSV